MAVELEAVKRAAENVRQAEARLAEKRAVLRQEILLAVERGATLSAVARAAGVSRQWVSQLVKEGKQ